MTSILDNADTFLNANSDLFNDLSESDLLISEKLVFIKGETVTGTIVDISVNDRIGMIKVELKVNTGDHAGKLHELVVFKPKANAEGKISPISKKQWVEFLLAFFTKEEILGGKTDFTKFTGSNLSFVAGEAKEYNGKPQQRYNSYKVEAPF